METGLQLFGRLTSRPSIARISTTLFPNDLKQKEVVEISGDPASGKTHLLTSLIATCILPSNYEGFCIGGLQAGVIFLNTDLHFQIFKLVTILDYRLKHCRNADGSCLNPSQIENIIKSSLENLHIYDCANTFVLRITIHSLQQTIASNPKISLIVLDSVSANYWQDVHQGGTRKIDLYTDKILKFLQKIVTDFNLSIIYTRPTYFKSMSSKVNRNVSQHPLIGFINHKIELRRPTAHAESGVVFFRAEIRCHDKVVFKYYKNKLDGFEWIELDALPNQTTND
ncbi:DNA repair protein XRCC2 [Nilaparvata lugens]|uniref:DNA repair protein XRCC2 n=1 Tax=Nilaparvata lugens TaxID=108931 RepID=UPI000B9835BF|nr:DNA repair protein XRCC2 [Nilaparvata lugens]